MTDADRLQIKNFEAKVRQLLSQFTIMKQENADLYNELERKEAEIERLNTELRQAQRNYTDLKTAKMLTVSDTDVAQVKQRITRLVREVNKCIAMLSTEL